jgi:hypothetical protein
MMIHSKYRRNVWFWAFDSLILGAAFFFFVCFYGVRLPIVSSCTCLFQQTKQACFCLLHVILVKSIASSIIHKISVNSSLAKALALVPLDALLGTTLATLRLFLFRLSQIQL